MKADLKKARLPGQSWRGNALEPDYKHKAGAGVVRKGGGVG